MKKYKDLWLEKNYIKVMLANIITRLGDGIDTIAFSWLRPLRCERSALTS